MMENHHDWKKAGFIAQQCLRYGKELVKPGVPLLEVAEKIEAKIKQMDGQLAFPVNISLNKGAAHFTPKFQDSAVFGDDDIVKLDVGVHVNGAIGDNALTVDLSGSYTDLVRSCQAALKAVEKILSPETQLGEIGRTIQETIEGYGYVPVRNLSGHSLEPYDLHAGITIPNIDTKDDHEIFPGMYMAIEPFATDGSGEVVESSNAQIFRMEENAKARNAFARNIIKRGKQFQGFPFAKRWLPQQGIDFGLRELINNGSIEFYNPLVEKEGGMVSQHEFSYFVGENKVEKLTVDEESI